MTESQPNVLSSKETPLPPEYLADPRLKKQIQEAKERIERGGTSPGMTADELVDLARGKQVGTRTRRSG